MIKRFKDFTDLIPCPGSADSTLISIIIHLHLLIQRHLGTYKDIKDHLQWFPPVTSGFILIFFLGINWFSFLSLFVRTKHSPYSCFLFLIICSISYISSLVLFMKSRNFIKAIASLQCKYIYKYKIN